MKFSRTSWQPLAAAILAIAPLTATVSAQTTATTTPVGFITVSVPAGTANSPSNKAVAIPLYNAPAFIGAVSSIDNSTSFTMSGATWTAGQFTTTAHVVRIRSGTQTGRLYTITGNTANQLTVDTRGGSLAGVLSVNDSCEVIPANTLGTVFGTTTPIVQTGASALDADNVFIWNGTTFDTYFHDGTNWRKAGSLLSQNNTVIYPDEGVFVARRATSPLTLTFMGTVPSGTEKTELETGSTFIGNRFPIDVQLGAIGFQSTTGWVAGADASTADKVFVWNGTTWDTYYYNGTNWRKAGNLNNQDTTLITAGTSLFITRSGANPAVLSQALPYTP
jgi:uncharacterized protein (TIGR02597 family)